MKPVVILRIFFAAVLIAMLFATVRASLDYPLWRVGARIGDDAWFRATLADAYCGFLTFYCWVAYLERTIARRLLWLALILAGGNIAMAAYALLRLCRLPADANARDILLRKEDR